MNSTVKIFSSFLLCLLPTILWGQVIQHYSNIDAQWNVAKTYPAASPDNPDFVATTTTVFGFQGDTLIDNKQWFKLYVAADELFQNDLVYRGLIREEANKVLYINPFNELDTLYDFNLEMGDTFLFNINGMYPEWLAVIAVDYVEIGGENYKRIKFEEPSMTAFDKLNEVWIEGIGSIHGPLFPDAPIKFSEEIPDSMLLTCSYAASQQVWNHPSYSDCYVNMVLGIEESTPPNFKLYPNPFTDYLHISMEENSAFHLEVFNNVGQIIKKFGFLKNTETIDLSELEKGIYFLRFQYRGSDKIVKVMKR